MKYVIVSYPHASCMTLLKIYFMLICWHVTSETLLLLAAQEGRFVTAKYIFDLGADPTASDNHGLYIDR
jgi:hypothetical protein